MHSKKGIRVCECICVLMTLSSLFFSSLLSNIILHIYTHIHTPAYTYNFATQQTIDSSSAIYARTFPFDTYTYTHTGRKIHG